MGVAGAATVAETAWGDLGQTRVLPQGLMSPFLGLRYLTTTFDTLWRISSDIAQQSVSVQQVMLEIVATNPDAFVDGNVNGLKSKPRLAAAGRRGGCRRFGKGTPRPSARTRLGQGSS